mgnify:CR=1 FL=1
MVETFYTDKGLPIDADPDYKYDERYQLEEEHETAKLNLNREPRYYAFIGYDRGSFEVSGDTIQLKMRYREAHGKPANSTNYSYTGFLVKKGIHPENYRLVAFKDMSNDHVFLCRSAVSTKETIEVNGETYPVYKMEISNTSHPFYTGKMKLVDTAGRVDKFMSRYAKRYDKKAAK